MKSDKHVVVALSGGVDSAICAKLMQNADFEVFGATLLLKPEGKFAGATSCFSDADRDAVDKLVQELGIEHRYIEGFEAFATQVLYPAACQYLAGKTPNPCVNCNPKIKLDLLLDFADSIGAEFLATGHYAQIVEKNGILYVAKGADPDKDQSYFLYRLGQNELKRLIFPVGGLVKNEVRSLASEYKLGVAHKPDSQDACFLFPGESFGETLRRFFDLKPQAGNFIYKGKIVGSHKGIHNYTIGQRKGLGVALGVPGYIAQIDAESGDITLVTDSAQLESQGFSLLDPVWAGCKFPESVNPMVRLRYRSSAVECKLSKSPNGDIQVKLASPQKAVTPGQSAVFYHGDLVLGGGIIGEIIE